MSVPIQYASFLIRVWRENKASEASLSADWHAEVEHIQSARYWAFVTTEDLLSFLKRQAESLPADDHPDEEKPSVHEEFPEK